MSFFSIGSSDAGRTYPLKEGNPKRVLMLARGLGIAVDVDRWINPLDTSCDAYALTEKGVHLFWVLPNKPSPVEIALGDELHNKLNAGGRDYPVFFESKTTGFVRTCSAVTEAGLSLARDYNALALKLWRERLDEEAQALAKRREEANREFAASVTDDDADDSPF